MTLHIGEHFSRANGDRESKSRNKNGTICMNITKVSFERLQTLGITDDRRCGRCLSHLEVISMGRSIWWFRPFKGGSGEVRHVGDIYCPRCDEKPELPEFGTPIYEDEIVTVSRFDSGA